MCHDPRLEVSYLLNSLARLDNQINSNGAFKMTQHLTFIFPLCQLIMTYWKHVHGYWKHVHGKVKEMPPDFLVVVSVRGTFLVTRLNWWGIVFPRTELKSSTEEGSCHGDSIGHHYILLKSLYWEHERDLIIIKYQ